MIKLDEIIEAVGELEINSDEIFEACVCLLFAEFLGQTDPEIISNFTGIDLMIVRGFCRNWRRGGIFKKDQIIKSSGWSDDDGDLSFAFVLDACVAIGLTKRIRTE